MKDINFDAGWIYNNTLTEDVKYVKKEQLVNYVGELELLVMQLQSTITSISKKVVRLDKLGFTIDKRVMKALVDNSYMENKINLV